MYKLKFNDPIHIHFIGIGGISMSGLAEILLGEDFKVSGSDSANTDKMDMKRFMEVYLIHVNLLILIIFQRFNIIEGKAS